MLVLLLVLLQPVIETNAAAQKPASTARFQEFRFLAEQGEAGRVVARIPRGLRERHPH